MLGARDSLFVRQESSYLNVLSPTQMFFSAKKLEYEDRAYILHNGNFHEKTFKLALVCHFPCLCVKNWVISTSNK